MSRVDVHRTFVAEPPIGLIRCRVGGAYHGGVYRGGAYGGGGYGSGYYGYYGGADPCWRFSGSAVAPTATEAGSLVSPSWDPRCLPARFSPGPEAILDGMQGRWTAAP
jgi:hypothetical protein